MKVLTDNKYYGQIADIVREQNGTSNTYTPPQMVRALKDLFYEEVEGVPPISFQGIGENLLDYRIDGASGGVGERTNNLFDKNNPKMLTSLYISATGQVNVTSSNSRSIIIPCAPSTIYNVKFKYSTYTLRIASFSIYPAINKTGDNVNIVTNGTSCNSASYMTSETANYLFIFCYNVATQESSDYSIDEFFSEIMVCQSPTPLSYEPYGYKVPVVISGKNLFDGQFESGSGISSGNNRCRAKNPIQVEAGKKYTLSHTITNDFNFVINSSTNKTYPFDSNTITICGNSITWKSDNITFSCTNNGYISIVVRKQDNSNIYPDEIDTSLQIMFEESSTATDYEPYIEPTTTNIYLDEPIEENESISLSDTNVDIPTIRGTNILSVDTTVQPSNVYVKSRKESQYEIALRQYYESIINS